MSNQHLTSPGQKLSGPLAFSLLSLFFIYTIFTVRVASALTTTVGSLPSPWSNLDIGGVGITGYSNYANGQMQLTGSGWDIWDGTDAFQYAYQPLTGDGEIVARVASQQNTHPWAKAGVMIRDGLAANARHASVFLTPVYGVGFQCRTETGGLSVLNLGGGAAAQPWLRLQRRGTTINGYHSPDGTRWTLISTATIDMPSTIYIGLAVTSHNNASTSTTSFTNINVGGSAPTPTPTPVPAAGPWANLDIGNVGNAGNAAQSNGVWTIKGSGADIWETADAFNFAYVPFTGDGQISARLASLQNTHPWAKAGVMMREELAPSARYVGMLITPGNGTAFQRRQNPHNATAFTAGAAASAPHWVRLVRAGSSFSAYTSVDGVNWALVGTDTVRMADRIYIGLAVTSHSQGVLSTAVFGNVSTSAGNSGSPTPTPTIAPVPRPTATPPVSTMKQFYVAEYGNSAGDGSQGRPWDLWTALSQPAALKPGSTVWVRGGTYVGAFTSKLTGTEAAPIVVRVYPGERAIIDGNGQSANPLTVNGAWTTYWGLEVMNSDPNRSRARPGAVNVFGAHTKFINMIVHDACEGFGFWTSAVDAELYGNLIFNGGWQGPAPDRGHGHGIYTQNNTGTKIVRDNIVFNQYGYGFHAYTEGSAINGYRLEGNVLFNNGQPVRERSRDGNLLIGGLKPAERISVVNNFTYHPLNTNSVNAILHWYAANNRDLEVRGNYFANGNPTVSIREWQQVQFTGNTVAGKWNLLGLFLPAGVGVSAYTWENNLYYQNGPATTVFNFMGSQLYLSQWQAATGFDRNGRFTQGAAPTQVFVRPNQYEAGRGHVIVYNAELRSVVSVDLSSVLKSGDRYEVRNAQDYFASPILAGTYNGGAVQLPMNGLTVAQPIGSSGLLPTGPEFNVFVIVRLP